MKRMSGISTPSLYCYVRPHGRMLVVVFPPLYFPSR